MGGWLSRKKIEPIRRSPLKTKKEIMKNTEAIGMITYAIEFAPPGTSLRWEKMLRVANRTIEPTVSQPDPLRLDIQMDVLKSILKDFYSQATLPANSDDVVLMRENLPKLYDKHSFERGRRVSQKERDERGLSDPCYAYGELDCEVLSKILFKITSSYGMTKNGIFYDLGCGVGNLVFAASFLGNFKKCVGVENIKSLLERGEKRMLRWTKLSENLTDKYKKVDIEWINDDFIESSYWIEATFILLHWTSFTKEQRLMVAETVKACSEGTIFVAFTQPIPNPDLEILITDTCETSWGETEYFVQEKLTTAKPLPMGN